MIMFVSKLVSCERRLLVVVSQKRRQTDQALVVGVLFDKCGAAVWKCILLEKDFGN